MQEYNKAVDAIPSRLTTKQAEKYNKMSGYWRDRLERIGKSKKIQALIAEIEAIFERCIDGRFERLEKLEKALDTHFHGWPNNCGSRYLSAGQCPVPGIVHEIQTNTDTGEIPDEHGRIRMLATDGWKFIALGYMNRTEAEAWFERNKGKNISDID